MKKIILLAYALFCTIIMHSQVIKSDKQLECLGNAIVLLRQDNIDNRNYAMSILRQNKKWTLMDELKDSNNNECWLTKKMKRFNLVPILTEVLTERYGKNLSRGDFLNGEDPRFDYSIIEKGIKAKKKVKYTFQGRIGKQDFVIIPCDPTTVLSIKFSKGSSALKTVQQKDKDGCVYLYIDAKLKSTDKITLEIENKSNNNVAIAILNHNTRK